MPMLDRLFARLNQEQGSDLHLIEGQPPLIRRFGQLAPIPDEPVLTHEALATCLKEITPPALWVKFECAGDCEFSHDVDELAVRFRVNCFRQRLGFSAVCRSIPGPGAVASLDELGLPAVFKDLVQLRSGLVLITGPMGSGKSTTVAAMLNTINVEQNRRILTVEDPLEFVFKSVRSMIAQREPGRHTLCADTALREAARQGCDVVFVGELHDYDAIRVAVNLADAGLLVFGTLRSSSTMKALDRVINCCPTVQQAWVRSMLSNCLKSVCAQMLVPKADGSGRCPVNEILICTPGVASAIREGYISKLGTMIQAGGADGMIVMDDALARKIEAKTITLEEAVLKASNKARFQAKAKIDPPPVTPALTPTISSPAPNVPGAKR